MTHRLSFNPYLHTSQAFQVMVEALDRPVAALPALDLSPPPVPEPRRFHPAPPEMDEVRRLLPQANKSGQGFRYVLLNANASDLLPLRRWPSERYVELANRLLVRYPNLCVVFTGAPREAEAINALTGQIRSPRCVSVAGKTTLRQLLVLCCLADVLVTNDSGPAHFASLTLIEVVVLFGPETPRLFAPLSSRTHPLWAGIACSPCVNAFNDRQSACSNNLCMQKIGVEQVFEKVSQLYKSRVDPQVSVPLRHAG
jgi:ADP-heptose:LPS heptosyltransferase